MENINNLLREVHFKFSFEMLQVCKCSKGVTHLDPL